MLYSRPSNRAIFCFSESLSSVFRRAHRQSCKSTHRIRSLVHPRNVEDRERDVTVHPTVHVT